MIAFLKGYNIFKTLVLIVVVYSIFYWFLRMETASRAIKFISDLGVIIAIVGFILTQLNEIERREDENITNFNEQQETGFIEIERQFLKYYPELFPLYKEMHLENNILQSLQNPPQIDPIKKIQYECNIFNIITQRIENILSSAASLNFEEFRQSATYNEWVKTWRQWFQSPTLRHLWSINRSYYFAPVTMEFIDRVIIGGTNLKPHTDSHIGLNQRPNQTDLGCLIGGRRTVLSKGRLLHSGFSVPYF